MNKKELLLELTKEQLIEKVELLQSRVAELQKANNYLNGRVRQYEHDDYLDGPDDYTRAQTRYDRFY